MRVLIPLAAALLLTACGQAGKLYLPGQAADQRPPPAPAAPRSAARPAGQAPATPASSAAPRS